MPGTDATIAPNLRMKARASLSNVSGRYEAHSRVVHHDGWDMPEDEVSARTQVSLERPRSVLTRNTSPDLSFDRSINPYRGCEHGCIYCFARPTHAWLGLSPGLDFETRLVARPEAPDILRQELAARRYSPATVAIGTNTDPYQPIEARYGIMRELLQVLRAHNHPVTVVTKGTLIERDIDILGEMGRAGLAQVAISVTSLDVDLARRMEPRAPTAKRRLTTIERLSRAGCPVRIMVAPIISALSDHELEAILAAAASAGATAAGWIMLRLPREVSPLFREWLAHHYPDRAARIMARVREMHGGKDYDAQWRRRMRGEGIYADLIALRFKVAVKRLGLLQKSVPLRCYLFHVPGRAVQLSLL